MTHPQIPLGLDRPTVGALVAAGIAVAVVAGSAATSAAVPWLVPVAAAGVVLGLGGGLLWGHFRLRRAVALELLARGEAVADVRLADGGLVPRWEVRLADGDRVALVGTAFGPRNPLFLEDEDGLRRIRTAASPAVEN